MQELLDLINNAAKDELYEIINNLKQYATSRDIDQLNLKLAVDMIIAASKKLDPTDRTSDHAVYRAYGVTQ